MTNTSDLPNLSGLVAYGESIAPGRISGLRLIDDSGTVSLILDVTGIAVTERDGLEEKLRAGFFAQPGVTQVRIAMTSEKKNSKVIAVASGKGGVGKSTFAANIAVSLHRLGRKVGLVDADIHGPSQPRLMSSENVRPGAQGSKLVPVRTRWGVPLLSVGQIVEQGKAVAWRGPMAGKALAQLIDAAWGDTEVLIVDLPPGTGDVQLSMIQRHKPTGAVIVSTPQDLALMDAARAIDLFGQADVPIIGLAENMAGYTCPHCGEVSDPFGSGGAEAAAAAMGIAFLGRVPLTVAIRTASDAGTPPAAGEGEDAEAFVAIARSIGRWLDNQR